MYENKVVFTTLHKTNLISKRTLSFVVFVSNNIYEKILRPRKLILDGVILTSYVCSARMVVLRRTFQNLLITPAVSGVGEVIIGSRKSTKYYFTINKDKE